MHETSGRVLVQYDKPHNYKVFQKPRTRGFDVFTSVLPLAY